jgi:hypothetical protein
MMTPAHLFDVANKLRGYTDGRPLYRRCRYSVCPESNRIVLALWPGRHEAPAFILAVVANLGWTAADVMRDGSGFLFRPTSEANS